MIQTKRRELKHFKEVFFIAKEAEAAILFLI